MDEVKHFTPENCTQFLDKIKALNLPDWVGIYIYDKEFIKESTMDKLMNIVADIAQHKE